MKKIKYTHFTLPPYGKPIPRELGAATVAAQQEENNPWIWKCAMALCSPEDNFCRKTGRLLALRKLFSDVEYCSCRFYRQDTETFSDFCLRALRTMLNDLRTNRPDNKPDRWYDHVDLDYIKARPNKPNKIRRVK